MRIARHDVHAWRFILPLLIAFSTTSLAGDGGRGATPVSMPAPRPASFPLDLTDELLDRFRPALYFVDDVGPGGQRIDYPCSYVVDDGDIENNYARLVTPAPSLCYGAVHQQRDANGKICLVVEYDYYYPRNWTELPPPQGCFTHEHDWEWIYIVVGYDEGEYRPYCACFSAHTPGNPDLFFLGGKVRLFPSVAGGSVWRTEWDRHPEWAPRVSLGWGEHVEATALSSGNAFDGSPTQPRSPSYWTHYEVRRREPLSSSCTSSERFCYGDPGMALLCIGRSSLGECDDVRDPPWLRDGLGAQDPLPDDFALPDDWEENPSTEHQAQGQTPRLMHAGPNPCRGRLDVALPAHPLPARLDLLDAGGRLVHRLSCATSPIETTHASFDLGGLSSGLYLLRAHWSGEDQEVIRVVLLR